MRLNKENIKKDKDREVWCDVARGFGIFLVFVGHWFFGTVPVRRMIYSFHMPLFFVLSGIHLHSLLKKDSFGFCLLVLHRCIVPYLFFWLVAVAIVCMLAGGGRLFEGFVSGHPEVNGPLWFLVSLAGAQSLLYVMVRLRIPPASGISVLAAMCLIVECLPYRLLCRMPLMMPSWPHAAFFMAMGYYGLGNQRLRMLLDRYAVSAMIAFAGITMGLAVLVHPAFMAINFYSTPGFFLVTGLSGSIALMASVLWLMRTCRHAMGIFEYAGIYSLVLFAMDRALAPLWRKTGLESSLIGFVLHVCLVLGLAPILQFVLGKIQALTMLPFLRGKDK